jgi:hypothetical protein
VLKTELSADEKVTLIEETSNQLFVWNIINICAVTIISTSRAFDSTFYVKNFTSIIKDVRCKKIRTLRLNFIPATGIVRGFYGMKGTSLQRCKF